MEPLSPELVLVDPDLAARARAGLPERVAAPAVRAPRPYAAAPAARATAEAPHGRPYPFWARITAALWLLVLGILIGGAAIPHAQDRPRVVPPDEDASRAICEAPPPDAVPPMRPLDPRGQP